MATVVGAGITGTTAITAAVITTIIIVTRRINGLKTRTSTRVRQNGRTRLYQKS
jgi:nitrate reductase gamma subunit